MSTMGEWGSNGAENPQQLTWARGVAAGQQRPASSCSPVAAGWERLAGSDWTGVEGQGAAGREC